MSRIKSIRQHLGVTQQALACALGCAQGNVSFYEKGQTVPPATAERLIAFAASRGLPLTFDHVYGGAALPKFDAEGGTAPVAVEGA
jgi:putative transcriptional regulator